MQKIFILMCLLFSINCNAFTLTKLNNRTNDYSLIDKYKSQIQSETINLSEEELIDYSIKFTANHLKFDAKNNINNGYANCVGYAKLCSSVYNYAIKVNNLNGCSNPVVGYVKLNGVNLCTTLKEVMPTTRLKLFVKDHDFVEFRVKNHIIYEDPCAYDLIFDKCTTKVK